MRKAKNRVIFLSYNNGFKAKDCGSENVLVYFVEKEKEPHELNQLKIFTARSKTAF